MVCQLRLGIFAFKFRIVYEHQLKKLKTARLLEKSDGLIIKIFVALIVALM